VFLSSCEYALFLYEEEIFFLKEKSVLVKGMANINISFPQVWAPRSLMRTKNSYLNLCVLSAFSKS